MGRVFIILREGYLRLHLHITQSAQPRPGHNEVHSILLSVNDEPPFLSKVTPRDLGGLANAGFSGIEIGNAQKELIEKGTAVLEGVNVDENYVRPGAPFLALFARSGDLRRHPPTLT